MDGPKILEVIERYRKYFIEKGIGIRDFPEDGRPSSKKEILAHCHGMLNKMVGFVKEGRIDKAFRWLGFIQGCLWSTRRHSLKELKNHSRPNKEVVDTKTIPEAAVPKLGKKRRPPSYVDGTGIYGSYPVCWAVMQVLTKRSDQLVLLDDIVRNEWLIKNSYGIGMLMRCTPPREEEAKRKIKRAINHLRSRGYEIETMLDDDKRLGYLTGETSIF